MFLNESIATSVFLFLASVFRLCVVAIVSARSLSRSSPRVFPIFKAKKRMLKVYCFVITSRQSPRIFGNPNIQQRFSRLLYPSSPIPLPAVLLIPLAHVYAYPLISGIIFSCWHLFAAKNKCIIDLTVLFLSELKE